MLGSFFISRKVFIWSSLSEAKSLFEYALATATGTDNIKPPTASWPAAYTTSPNISPDKNAGSWNISFSLATLYIFLTTFSNVCWAAPVSASASVPPAPIKTALVIGLLTSSRTKVLNVAGVPLLGVFFRALNMTLDNIPFCSNTFLKPNLSKSAEPTAIGILTNIFSDSGIFWNSGFFCISSSTKSDVNVNKFVICLYLFGDAKAGNDSAKPAIAPPQNPSVCKASYCLVIFLPANFSNTSSFNVLIIPMSPYLTSFTVLSINALSISSIIEIDSVIFSFANGAVTIFSLPLSLL